MTQAPFDYRFRYLIHSLLFVAAFAFYWLPGAHESTWLVLTPAMERTGLFSFTSATVTLLMVAMLCLVTGALLRTWASAFLGAGIVEDRNLHGSHVLADGPFRHVRNPLYLGTLLHAVGLALILSPYGAIFIIVTIGLYQLRLIQVEEPYLTATLGEPYVAYKRRVPRLLPSLAARLAAAGVRPQWLPAVISESYMLGVAISFAIFGWRYNSDLLMKCVIISLGVSLVLRAAMPAPRRKPSTM